MGCPLLIPQSFEGGMGRPLNFEIRFNSTQQVLTQRILGSCQVMSGRRWQCVVSHGGVKLCLIWIRYTHDISCQCKVMHVAARRKVLRKGLEHLWRYRTSSVSYFSSSGICEWCVLPRTDDDDSCFNLKFAHFQCKHLWQC